MDAWISDLKAHIKHFDEYYAGRTPDPSLLATYQTWVDELQWLTEKGNYSMVYSHYNSPGCVQVFTFEAVRDIFDFLKEKVPKSKDDKWKYGWYPNGLELYENHVNKASQIVMGSIGNRSEYEDAPPEPYLDKYKVLATFIFEMHKLVEALDN
jgi:hypothetical protein